MFLCSCVLYLYSYILLLSIQTLTCSARSPPCRRPSGASRAQHLDSKAASLPLRAPDSSLTSFRRLWAHTTRCKGTCPNLESDYRSSRRIPATWTWIWKRRWCRSEGWSAMSGSWSSTATLLKLLEPSGKDLLLSLIYLSYLIVFLLYQYWSIDLL